VPERRALLGVAVDPPQQRIDIDIGLRRRARQQRRAYGEGGQQISGGRLQLQGETLRVSVREAEQAAVPGAAGASALDKENRQLRARVRELELEREILRRAAKYFRGRDQLVSRFQFVDHHRAYGVKRLCALLAVSRVGVRPLA